MITASVSWLVLIYPALERTRFLAKRAFVLARAAETSRLARVENENLIAAMADRVIQARIDLVLFPILMHFYPIDQNETLAPTHCLTCSAFPTSAWELNARPPCSSRLRSCMKR